MAGYRQETPELDPQLAPVRELKAFIAAGKVADSDRKFAGDLVSSCLAGHATPGRLEWVGKLVERVKFNDAGPAHAVDPVVTELETLIGQVPARDQAFAKDLIRSCKAGQATPGRMKWVNTLRDRAKAADTQVKAQTAYDRVAEKTGLKVSTIKRVARRLEKQLHGWSADEVLAVIEEQPARLAEIAKEYGDATHECCFCGIDLTDERSTSKGYGPICAAKYNLPWGE